MSDATTEQTTEKKTEYPIEMVTKMETRSMAVLNAMAKGEFSNAGMHFDSVMTSLLPAGKIEELWHAIQAKAGSYVEALGGRVATAGGQPVIVIDCKFANHNANIYVTFDAQANISGLHAGPEFPAQRAPEVHEAPANANEPPRGTERLIPVLLAALLAATLYLVSRARRVPAPVRIPPE